MSIIDRDYGWLVTREVAVIIGEGGVCDIKVTSNI
jgi:hypothetical protein